MAKPLYETGFNWSPGRGVLEYTDVYRGGLKIFVAAVGYNSGRDVQPHPTFGSLRSVCAIDAGTNAARHYQASVSFSSA